MLQVSLDYDNEGLRTDHQWHVEQSTVTDNDHRFNLGATFVYILMGLSDRALMRR
jgi:hypothetical protein